MPSLLARTRAGAHRLGSTFDKSKTAWGLIGGEREAWALVKVSVEYSGTLHDGVEVRGVTLPDGTDVKPFLERGELYRLAMGSAAHWEQGRDEYLSNRKRDHYAGQTDEGD